MHYFNQQVKDRSWLALSGVRLLRFLDTMSPAEENSHSTGTNVAGIGKYCCANLDSLG